MVYDAPGAAMGLFENNYDTDTLRAIAYARMQIEAGKGLESIIHSMASADLGTIASALKQPLDRMRRGDDTLRVLQDAIEKAENRAFSELLSALVQEGQAAIQRMDELSEDIQSDRRVKVENFGKSIQSRLNFIAILFLATFVPILLRVLEQIPPNAILPQVQLPPWFYTFYVISLGVLLTVLVITMRYTE